jgi:uncharacterized protein YeeX (DUF496 family)
MIRNNSNLELLECGVQVINNKMKDVDLLFMDNAKKIIYYRELKGNIELDTEKLPATIAKCNEILAFLKSKYVDYYIDYAILNWSIYNRRLLTAGLSNIKLLEKEGLRIEHMGEFCDTAGIAWGEEDYYSYFREIGGNISDSAAA